MQVSVIEISISVKLVIPDKNLASQVDDVVDTLTAEEIFNSLPEAVNFEGYELTHELKEATFTLNVSNPES